MALKVAVKADSEEAKKEKRKVRYVQKHRPIFKLVEKIKLWPSRSGILHGIRSITKDGNFMIIETHCNKVIKARISKNGRAARWLRNKWAERICKSCRIPSWKISKFANTLFK